MFLSDIIKNTRDRTLINVSSCRHNNEYKFAIIFCFQFLGNVSSSQILAVLLKHLHQLAMFVPYFTRLRRPLLKRLVTLWGSGEETVRVVAFLCLLKITTNQQQALLERVLKV
jgi:nucleolar complex protein 2